jgi:hypothetical protein
MHVGFRLMTSVLIQGRKPSKHDDRHSCCSALCEARGKSYDGFADGCFQAPAVLGQGGFAMLNATSCNAALAVLIVLAALGPAIVDVARLAKCAIVPCRNKDSV